ncbi:hypothetical protein [Dapis sp. BLCC M172]|uniref:hypothetical protein n=1 Tax=Dapis sp. BLCC M172 TaxID=2975281 RepID=UPI003CF1736C
MKSAKFSDAATDSIIRLAALAAVVDGEASDKEKNLIVEEASHLLRTSHDNVRLVLDIWLNKYQNDGAGNSPAIALNFAMTELQALNPSEKHLAFHICQEVINIEKTVIKSELPFMLQLHKLIYS